MSYLNQTGDYYDAERFAQVCYDSFTCAPLDPNSYEAAIAASNLPCASINLIKANGPESADIEEAEMLVRKAVRIVKELKGHGSAEMINIFRTLIYVLFWKKDSTD